MWLLKKSLVIFQDRHNYQKFLFLKSCVQWWCCQKSKKFILSFYHHEVCGIQKTTKILIIREILGFEIYYWKMICHDFEKKIIKFSKIDNGKVLKVRSKKQTLMLFWPNKLKRKLIFTMGQKLYFLIKIFFVWKWLFRCCCLNSISDQISLLNLLKKLKNYM